MQRCPVCGGEMTGGSWREPLPYIQGATGRRIRIGGDSRPNGAVCPNCTLMWAPASEFVAHGEGEADGDPCPACGGLTMRGRFSARPSDFISSSGEAFKLGVAGDLSCSTCEECGLVRVPGKRFLRQSPDAARAEVTLRGRGRANRIITECIVGGVPVCAALGAAIAREVARVMYSRAYGYSEWVEYYAEDAMYTGMVWGALLGPFIGAAFGAFLVVRLRLPRPWRKRANENE